MGAVRVYFDWYRTFHAERIFVSGSMYSIPVCQKIVKRIRHFVSFFGSATLVTVLYKYRSALCVTTMLFGRM